jgi:hypothetical protein
VLRFLHIWLRLLSAALLLWAVLVVAWSYPHPWLTLLGIVAAIGAGASVAGAWKLRRRPRRGAVLLTVGAGVCLVLLSWSPPAAIASLILLVSGVILWGRSIGGTPSGGQANTPSHPG